MVYRSGCDVVPVCIKTKGFKYGLFRRKEIIFGKLIPYSEFGFQNGGNEEYKRATERIFGDILALGGYAKTNETEEGAPKE